MKQFTLPKKKENKRKAPSKKAQGNKFRSHPISPSIDHILHLQQTIGNQAVQRMIKSGELQLKDNRPQPGDVYTREVEALAQRVLMLNVETALQTQFPESRCTSSVIQRNGKKGAIIGAGMGGVLGLLGFLGGPLLGITTTGLGGLIGGWLGGYLGKQGGTCADAVRVARDAVHKTDSKEYKDLSSKMCWDAVEYCGYLAGVIRKPRGNRKDIVGLADKIVSDDEAMNTIPEGNVIGFFHNDKLIHAMLSTGHRKAAGNKNECIGIGKSVGWEVLSLTPEEWKWRDGFLEVPGARGKRKLKVRHKPITEVH